MSNQANLTISPVRTLGCEENIWTRSRCAHGFLRRLCPYQSRIHGELLISELTKHIEPLSWLPAAQRSLLHHFVHHASQLSTCDAEGQILICQMLIPRALRSPAMLKALLAQAAVHKLNHVESAYEREKLDSSTKSLVDSSVQALQIEMKNPNPRNRSTMSAVALLLCEQAVHGADGAATSWRAHMEGAKALMASVAPGDVQEDDLELLSFLHRWYRAFESLAALTSRGLSTGQLEFGQPQGSVPSRLAENDYVDEYIGYTGTLNGILREIGALAWERSQNSNNDLLVPLSGSDLDAEADWLELAVWRLLDQSRTSAPVFYPGVAKRFTPREIDEFVACNEAFHHMALIHLKCRIRRLSPLSGDVQNSVKRIIECANVISPSSGLSPWLALTGPVFTAGCCAFGNTRDDVRDMMSRLHSTVQSHSMSRALRYLEMFWSQQGDHGYLYWDRFESQSGLDFIAF